MGVITIAGISFNSYLVRYLKEEIKCRELNSRMLFFSILLYSYIHQITPWCRALQKLIITQHIKKFLAFYGTWRFSTYNVNRSRPLDPILSQMNAVHVLAPCFFKVCFKIILTSMHNVQITSSHLAWTATIAI